MMTTRREQTQIRLRNDHREMENIRGPLIAWEPISGEEPFVDAYDVTVNVRTIIGPGPDYRDVHRIRVELPGSYPLSPPSIRMITRPQPFHPNWFGDGRWCYGSWDFTESLGRHLLRMIKTLQFDGDITNPNSPANTVARDWYVNRRNERLFPCDSHVLPDPTKVRFRVDRRSEATDTRRTFRIGQ